MALLCLSNGVAQNRRLYAQNVKQCKCVVELNIITGVLSSRVIIIIIFFYYYFPLLLLLWRADESRYCWEIQNVNKRTSIKLKVDKSPTYKIIDYAVHIIINAVILNKSLFNINMRLLYEID
jgi:hypothetical protein